MLNDIKTPPIEPVNPPATPTGGSPAGPARRDVPLSPLGHRPPPTEPGVRPHAGIVPHADVAEPGLHHARVMGDATKIEPIYEMPMEDRGSTFSVGLTIAAVVILAVVAIFVFYWIVR